MPRQQPENAEGQGSCAEEEGEKPMAESFNFFLKPLTKTTLILYSEVVYWFKRICLLLFCHQLPPSFFLLCLVLEQTLMAERVETQQAIRAAKLTKEEEEREEKWVKHYSSFHQILLVGEGDFSFSKSLAQSFGSASNIVASSPDSYDVVIKKYKQAKSNFEILEKLGASLLHEVDATKMMFHTNLKMRKFDRIIYNFPHAGFLGKEDDIRLIMKHRNLVHGFLRNARGMLRANGEIHVNHKMASPFCHWNLEELASKNSLVLIETVAFKKEDYPGYNNKRGSGLRCDEPFPLGDCSTFKFIFSLTAKKVTKLKNLVLSFGRSQELVEASITMPWKPVSFELMQPPNFITYNDGIQPLNLPHRRSHELLEAPQQPNYGNFSHPPSNFIPLMNGVPRCIGSPSPANVSMEWCRIFKGYFKHVVEAFRSCDYKASYFLHEALRLGYERYMAEDPARTPSGYISMLEELRRFSIADTRIVKEDASGYISMLEELRRFSIADTRFVKEDASGYISMLEELRCFSIADPRIVKEDASG